MVQLKRNEIEGYIERNATKNVYARCLPEGDKFNEDQFMKSRSFDYFVVEEPQTLEEAEELIELYDLPGEAEEREGKFGVRYSGVNATQNYDVFNQGHGTIVLFEGKYEGDNLLKDGDVVKPIKVLKVIEVVDDIQNKTEHISETTSTQSTGICKRCHRKLTNETAIKRGYGSTCWKKIGAE